MSWHTKIEGHFVNETFVVSRICVQAHNAPFYIGCIDGSANCLELNGSTTPLGTQMSPSAMRVIVDPFQIRSIQTSRVI